MSPTLLDFHRTSPWPNEKNESEGKHKFCTTPQFKQVPRIHPHIQHFSLAGRENYCRHH